MLAREPKLVEDAKTCVFLRGSQTSDRVRTALTELQQLKRPNAVSFSKRNAVHPFDDLSPLLFWHVKTDASLFIHASHSKKRPHNLTFVRLFDGQLLDMVELGVEAALPMSSLPGPKAAPGVAPLFHFVGEIWDQEERYGQVKSMVLDCFRGEELKGIDLVHGLQHVISVSVGSPSSPSSISSLLAPSSTANGTSAPPLPPAAAAPTPNLPILLGDSTDASASPTSLPLIHFRTYAVTLLRSGHRSPRVALAPHGPHFDFSLRRHTFPNPDTLSRSLKRSLPKTEAGKARKGKNKNIDIDEVGDKVGRVHVGRQDLDKLQSRKMKGLKRGLASTDDEEDEEDDDDDDLSDLEMEPVSRQADEMGAVVDVEGSVKRQRV